MDIIFHKSFKKDFKKQTVKTTERFTEGYNIFLADPFDPILNNHTLAGKYKDYRSINISGDIRAIYVHYENLIIFMRIGTHSELY
jgi:addiction module RelE/StbE family toxin